MKTQADIIIKDLFKTVDCHKDVSTADMVIFKDACRAIRHGDQKVAGGLFKRRDNWDNPELADALAFDYRQCLLSQGPPVRQRRSKITAHQWDLLITAARFSHQSDMTYMLNALRDGDFAVAEQVLANVANVK